MIIFVKDFVIAWKNSSKQNSTITAADMSARSSLIMQISVDGKDKKNIRNFYQCFEILKMQKKMFSGSETIHHHTVTHLMVVFELMV